MKKVVVFWLFCGVIPLITGVGTALAQKTAKSYPEVDRLLGIAARKYLNEPDSAVFYAKAAVTESEKVGYKTGQMISLRMVGAACIRKMDLTEGKKYLLASLALARKHKALYQETRTCMGMVMVSSINNDLTEAMSYSMQALRNAEALQDPVMIASIMNDQGNIYNNTGQYDQALRCYQRALEISSHVTMSPDLLHSALNNLAVIQERKGMYAEAAKNLQKALVYQRISGDIRAQVLSLGVLGKVLRRLNMPDSTERVLLLALRQAREIHDLGGQVVCLNNLADLYNATGRAAKAIPLANASIEIACQNQDPGNQQYATTLLSDACRKTGQLEEALVYQELAHALDLQINDRERQESVQLVKAGYELREKQDQIDDQQEVLRYKNLQLGAGLLLFILAGIFAALQFRSRQREQAISRQLSVLNGVKDKLIALISHDIRNPLATISGLLRIQGEALHDPARMASTHQLLRTQATSTLDLLDNLLYWSESQMNGLRPNPVVLDLGSLANECVAQATVLASAKGVALRVDEAEEALAYADQEMVRLVVRNLVTNAIKFTPAGGEVLLTTTEKDGKACLTVRDTGVGMTEEQAQRIFGGNGGGTTPGTKGEKGTGLGVQLCTEFAAANGGALSVSSAPGQGTTVVVELPGAE